MRGSFMLLLPLALVAVLSGDAAAVENPGRKPRATHGSMAAPTGIAESPGSSLPGAGKAPTGRGRGHHTLRGTVNINQADEATLELLPGVGEVTAGKIVALRRTRSFKRGEDITRVKGIGKKKLAQMRAFLSVSGASTLVEEDAAPSEALSE